MRNFLPNKMKRKVSYKDKITKNSLFLPIQYFSRLPRDWVDSVMFLVTHNLMIDTESSHLIVLEEEELKIFNRFVGYEQITLFVVDMNKNTTFNVTMMRCSDPGKENIPMYIGGEQLRKFCDDKDFFYKTFKAPNGELYSSTNFIYIRDEGEDCSIPQDLKE